ncbi:MAG TPA: DUF6600 domain-containing protein [Pyrinomonadaceae bacterium]|nr:DUF6600 domain-containing protein [Pyrinomonadaceae bacterium]
MNRIKVWPHMTIIAIVIAAVAGVGAALWMNNNERTASAEELPQVARIARVEGDVAFSDALQDASTEQSAEDRQWVEATANQPFSVGDRIYTREDSRASLAFSGRNFARLDPNTSLDVVSLYDDRTQVALRDGSALFDVGYLDQGEIFEVATPHGAVDFVQPGLYNVGFDNDGNVLVSVLSGLAQVAGLAGSGQISKGEMLTLAGTTAAQVLLSRMDGRDAGYLVDDYYRYQYPNVYDGRYVNYDSYLNDPFYYDPYRRNVAYQYVNYDIPGVYDLDSYGDWQNINGYGHAWRPRVDQGWTPYQQGYWVNDYPYGMTWVSSEPWGYTPYHYGRWVNSGNQWYWIPEGRNATPAYAPALVAFIPIDSNQIGWVPLGPGDPYAPRYYDANWQPHYLTNTDLIQTQLVNLAIPGAVTVIPVDQFGRTIDPRYVRRIDPGVLASVRPTLEPLALTPLRNAAINSAWGRGKKDLPPGIARKLDDRTVFVDQEPVRRRGGRDFARALRVERVPDQSKREKFKVRDNRGDQPVHSGRPDDVVRRQEIDRLSREAAKGNREAEQQARRLQQDQRKAQAEQQRNARRAVQQPQGQAVGNPGRSARPEPRGRQDVPKAREPQKRPQAAAQPQRVQSAPKAKAERGKPAARGQGGGKGKGKG